MTFDEIKNISKKDQPLALRESAKNGDAQSAVAYAKLVFSDKYKGELSGNKSKDTTEKGIARGEAIFNLVNLAKKGDKECAKMAIESNFHGVFAGFGKTLNRVNYSAAYDLCIMMTDGTISDVTNSEKSYYFYKAALLVNLLNKSSMSENVKAACLLLDKAIDLNDEIYSVKAKVKKGVLLYEIGNYDEAKEYLKSDLSSYTALVLLMLISKLEEKHDECRSYKAKAKTVIDNEK